MQPDYFNKDVVYGRLTLTGNSYFKKGTYNQVRMVEAICACGAKRFYVAYSLRNGSTRSCGCLKIEGLKSNPHAKTHGHTGHSLYTIYRGMKERCYNENHNRFHRYGGLGKYICKEWLDNFQVFFDWAMSNGWEEGLTIERVDNDGIYEPSNCTFIPQPDQSKNRSTSHFITAFGETKCTRDWSKDPRCKVTYWGLMNRIGRDKESWPDVEKAITTPPGTRGETVKYKSENRMLFAFGEEKSLTDWIKDERCVAGEAVIKNRLRVLNTRWKTIEAVLTTTVRKSRE